MKMIVGLGNPGAKYANNRHNIGFVLVDALANSANWRVKFQGEETRIKLAGEDVILLKPQTFMNNSGQSVAAAAKFYKLSSRDILVIHDELDLAPGRVKLKMGGGHAGHNGLRSIIAHMDAEFERLRIGIGHPGRKDAVTPYVLHDFAKADFDWIDRLTARMPTAMAYYVAGNASKMSETLQSKSVAKVTPVSMAPKPAPTPRAEKPASAFDKLRGLIKRD